MTETTPPFNPCVGPRTFQEEAADRFFGREREARELLALVVNERLTLFYAQSGAGKSSLLNARVIPRLRDQEGFTVLPMGRVSGVLPDEVDPRTIDNMFVYHLIQGLSQKLAEKEAQPPAGREQKAADLAHTSLARFLSGETGPDIAADAGLTGTASPEGLVPYVLIIDQFEELLTTYPDRWQERTGFFEQLSAAMARHPNLWVVLTLCEDYIAGLEPYSHLAPNRLRARFYMQRVGIESAREAVEQIAPTQNAPLPVAWPACSSTPCARTGSLPERRLSRGVTWQRQMTADRIHRTLIIVAALAGLAVALLVFDSWQVLTGASAVLPATSTQIFDPGARSGSVYLPFIVGPPRRAVAAIHVSELTQALDPEPGVPLPPLDTRWSNSAWHYFTMYQSLEEAFRSDGTPFEEVSDADIRAGRLLTANGSPTYPIMFSLSNEAVDDAELGPLRDYVRAGGFLFVGSSSFTRKSDGSSRNDFALGKEIGLHQANIGASPWYMTSRFKKVAYNRLVQGIPNEALLWRMPLNSHQTALNIFQGSTYRLAWYTFGVKAEGADIIAEASAGPLLTTKQFGAGRFIWYGAMQPILGRGAFDPSAYAYTIYREAVRWAFEAAQLPLIKLSPWPFPYDAAFIVRHDYENSAPQISALSSSAQFEHSLGVKGDYFFTTGTLRVGSEDHQLTDEQKIKTISDLRTAVSEYGATIGSHNGGLPNPLKILEPTTYLYWHWGPDDVLSKTIPGFESGAAYAKESIAISFQDIEGWLAGVDNGRPGCGAAGNCPRIWVAPAFASTDEESLNVLEDLRVAAVGEQEIGPFPHWVLSTETPGKRYDYLSLPISAYFSGTMTIQSRDYLSPQKLKEAVDFYYDLGGLINVYGHGSSDQGPGRQFVTYAASLPRIWATNSVEILDWWRQRSSAVVSQTYTTSAGMLYVTVDVSGAGNTDTAIEIVLPGRLHSIASQLDVQIDGAKADPEVWRTTEYGLKIRTGTKPARIQVRYQSPPVPQQELGLVNKQLPVLGQLRP